MCVFCDIVEGKIPSYKLYEDDQTIAILDISQATKGHTLVIPKKHYDDITSIPEDELATYIVSVQKVANKLCDKLSCEGFNILNNCKEIAGQSVMHLHFHILPRYQNDDLKIEFTSHEYDLENLAKQINE